MAMMSKLAVMGRALMSTPPAFSPLRTITLSRFSTDSTQSPPSQPPPVEADQSSPPPTIEADPTPAKAAAAQPDQAPPIEAAEPQSDKDASFDPFVRGSDQGMVFGRLTGIGKHTMKTDVIHLLEGCTLSIDDVKVEYNAGFSPLSMMLQFSSRTSFDMAVKQITRKGRLYRLDTIDRSQWDNTSSYNGKTVLLQGIPREVFHEDVERFLSGCKYDPSSIQINNSRNGPKFVLVQFQSLIDAMNAFTAKNRSFCLNNPVRMRVLQ